MTPNFTLSLSHDGIALLQRSAAGWAEIGRVDPTSADLADKLAALRRTASMLAPGGMRSRLVIPNDQIRYLTVDTPGMSEDARDAAARAALEGATPYALDELVFDTLADSDKTHIAAVAHETLEEAETFAREHGFSPVCFAALPDAGTAPSEWEVFFGATDAADEYLEDNDTEADDPPDAIPEASFISRRRVPTFRNGQDPFSPTSGTLPGFGEAPADLLKAPGPAPKSASRTASVVPAPPPIVRRPANEAERFTIYGAAAEPPQSGGIRASGAWLLAAVIVLGGLAAFAHTASPGGLPDLLSRLIDREAEARFTSVPEPQTSAPVLRADDVAPATSGPVELASLETGTDAQESVLPGALQALIRPEPETTPTPSVDEIRAEAAIGGIWPFPPEVPNPPPLVGLDDLYVTGIDPINQNFDAVALPAMMAQDNALNFIAPISPAPAGTEFVLDVRGMVVPEADGALNADGITVYAGPPPERPPVKLVKIEAPGQDLELRLRLSAFRPEPRPGDLSETTERASLSGFTRAELRQFRPRLRPKSEQENALAAASLATLDDSQGRALLQRPEGTGPDSSTAGAVVASLRPDARPGDFDRTVAKAMARTPSAAEPVATPAPRAVVPQIPSSASAARQATVRNAINLRRINLIGVYGKASSRSALVRLSNGRYRKVGVGDQIDGGRVSAIGDRELRYQKSGRSIVLTMPRG